MLKHLQPLPISEEMLGAYLEGNLTADEVGYVDSVLQTDELLKGIVEEVNSDGIELVENSLGQGLCVIDFQLPELTSNAIYDGITIIDVPQTMETAMLCSLVDNEFVDSFCGLEITDNVDLNDVVSSEYRSIEDDYDNIDLSDI
ncbi:MAG: hypothetical protein E7114_01310 [Bacteroidales bacterium]|nr:hypothetical protein [Bacteroidales bacterium]